MRANLVTTYPITTVTSFDLPEGKTSDDIAEVHVRWLDVTGEFKDKSTIKFEQNEVNLDGEWWKYPSDTKVVKDDEFEREEFLKSCSKETLIETLDNDHVQVLKHKEGWLYRLNYYDQNFSSEKTCGDRYAPGDKVYSNHLSDLGLGHRYFGTVVDPNTLSREGLLEVV